jgi:hypothetical protein
MENRKFKHVHVVAFDLPFPPNYGGSTDMYFKLVHLQKLGISVTLHVFLYDGKQKAPDLEKVTFKTIYYSRKRYKNPFIGKLPYIVKTRKNKDLFRNLLVDNSPILFEGLHTTYYLNHPVLMDRIRVVRAHNVEHNYYAALEKAEDSFLKKLFFRIEADRLRKYESVLHQANGIAGISPAETNYLNSAYGNTQYIPAFHANSDVVSRLGKGEFVLYHGNLSVPENNRAALYLVEEVFPLLNRPCIISGSNPSKKLVKAISKHENISLRANISTEEILELIESAHVNAMVTFQSTGIKLKLLNSLYRGRFVVANTAMVDETQLEDLCHISDKSVEFASFIEDCFAQDFSEEERSKRIALLAQLFDNNENAIKLAKMLQLEIN